MASEHVFTPMGSSPEYPVPVETGVMLTRAEFASLERELESLRSRYRAEVAHRLREARSFSNSPDDDDVLAVREEAAVDEARIAQLEELARSAVVVEESGSDGRAGLGSIVKVAADDGETFEYELVGRRSPESSGRDVSLSSPVGTALRGAHVGDVVLVALPGGRHRTLEVLAVYAGARAGGAPSTWRSANAA
jgi:transcription elongation factor GreA